jgi:hypothetical protein
VIFSRTQWNFGLGATVEVGHGKKNSHLMIRGGFVFNRTAFIFSFLISAAMYYSFDFSKNSKSELVHLIFEILIPIFTITILQIALEKFLKTVLFKVIMISVYCGFIIPYCILLIAFSSKFSIIPFIYISLFLYFALLFIFDEINKPENFNKWQIIATVLSFYPVLGICFAAMYSADGHINGVKSQFDYVYFSFTTLSTTGFGDLTPASIYSKTISIAESFIGGYVLLGILIAGAFGIGSPAEVSATSSQSKLGQENI